jgi:hypothetical protein
VNNPQSPNSKQSKQPDKQRTPKQAQRETAKPAFAEPQPAPFATQMMGELPAPVATSPTELTRGPQGLFGNGTTTNQVQLVSKQGALTAQRQGMVQTINEKQGNRQATQVVAQVAREKQTLPTSNVQLPTSNLRPQTLTPTRGTSVAQRKAATQHKNGDSNDATSETAMPTSELDVLGGSASGASFAASGTTPPDVANRKSQIAISNLQHPTRAYEPRW